MDYYRHVLPQAWAKLSLESWQCWQSALSLALVSHPGFAVYAWWTDVAAKHGKAIATPCRRKSA